MKNFMLASKSKKKGIVTSALFSVLILFFALNCGFSCCASNPPQQPGAPSQQEGGSGPTSTTNSGNGKNKLNEEQEDTKLEKSNTKVKEVTISDTLPSCDIS